MHVVIILAFVAPHLAELLAAQSEDGLPRAHVPVWLWALPWAACLLSWGVSHVASVRGERAANATGKLAGIEAAASMMTLAWLCTLLSVVSVSMIARGEFPAVLTESAQAMPAWLAPFVIMLGGIVLSLGPVLACIVLTHRSFARCDARVHEAVTTRLLDDGKPIYPPLRGWAFVAARLRRQAAISLTSIAIVSCAGALVAAVPDAWFASLAGRVSARIGQSLARNLSGETIRPIASAVTTAVALVLGMPHALRWTWGARTLERGPLRSRLQRIISQYRVRVPGPHAFAAYDGEATAMVVGGFWPSRFLFLTVPLLERLMPAQVDAVVAHEVGHVKHKHVLWMGVVALAAMLSGAWAGVAIARLLVWCGLWLDAQWLVRVAATQESLIAGLLSLVCSVQCFGFVSRRFEQQADAFAVRHLARDELASAGAAMQASTLITAKASHTVADMLQTVAEVNGMSTSRNDFRHGSIEARQARVLGLVGLPSKVLPVDRTVAAIKWLSALVLGGATAFIVVDMLRV